VEGQEAGSAAVGERPPLPTLPETAVGSGVTDSGAATELARALAGETASDWRVLAGFVGSQWDDELTGTIDVLVDTITVQDGVAMGLVRNGSTTNAGPILVTAGDVQAEAMVPVVRPGEPVPFRLPLGGIDPAALSWSAVAPQAGEVARGLQLTSWWQRGVTDPGPADTYLWTEPEQGPQPIVVFGTATAVDGAVADVGVASAWLDADGHVIGVADGIVGQATLRTGAAADFVVATTGPDALDDAQLMLWGWGA